MIALGKINKTIQKYRMLEPGDGVVVGVSGGRPTAESSHAQVRFTSLSPEIKTWIQQVVGQSAPLPSAVEPKPTAAP